MQAVECDLCLRFLSLALFFLSFTGTLFTAWLLTRGLRPFASRGFSFLTIIFRQATVNLTYCTALCQQSKPIEKHNLRNGFWEKIDYMMLNKCVGLCVHARMPCNASICPFCMHRNVVCLWVCIHLYTFLNCVKKMCVCHIMASLSCDPGPHVQPIRANQKAVIRAWRGDGGSVAVGGVLRPMISVSDWWGRTGGAARPNPISSFLCLFHLHMWGALFI